jgi:SCP-2 sterol transfer family
MSDWLSAEWFDETRGLWSDAPAAGNVAARLQCEVSGGPEGGLSCYWLLDGGRLVGSGPGGIDAPDVTVTLTWADALAVQRGHLDPSVAFMQGRLKVSGDMAVLVAVLPATNTEAFRDVCRRIAAATSS